MCEHKRKRVSYRQKGGRNWLSELLKVKRERERDVLTQYKTEKGRKSKIRERMFNDGGGLEWGKKQKSRRVRTYVQGTVWLDMVGRQ